jgi:23S rRNA (pseudouridine1915-N3)-methyltransferase
VVLCVGRVRGAPFADDVSHYRRLLERRATLEIIEVREGGGDLRRRKDVLKRESAEVLRRIPRESFVCALDREGTALSSIELARFLDERRQSATDLCFVVGGPFGLDRSVLERADRSISFGPITLPHDLARVVLLEQLFRAQKILSGEPYHY